MTNFTDHGGDFYQEVGEDFSNIRRHSKIINADVLDAWYDPSPSVIEAVSEHLPWLIRTSPPTHGDALRLAIASTRRIPPDCVLVGSGASDVIFTCLHRILASSTSAVILDPMYGEYSHVLRSHLHLQPVALLLNEREDFAVDVDKAISAASNAGAMILVNPNNPTGRAMPLSAIEAIAEQVRILIIDETYIDFSDEESAESLACSRSNVFVIKSMSKYYALSGLRIGYLVGRADAIDALRGFVPPWPVGTVSQLAALRALEDLEYYNLKKAETVSLRLNLRRMLEANPGVSLFPSDANFVMLKVSQPASEIVAKLRERSIYIRNCNTQSQRFTDDFVRIAVKDSAQNARLASAFREAIQSFS